MTTFPKEVPVLSAKNIHRGNYSGPNGTHCISGWEMTCFKGERAYSYLIREINTDLATYNDREPKAKVAKLWNRVMKKLGYRRRGKKFVRKA